MQRVLSVACVRVLNSTRIPDAASVSFSLVRSIATHGFQRSQHQQGHEGKNGGLSAALAGLGMLSFGIAAWPVEAKAPSPTTKPMAAASKAPEQASEKKGDPTYTTEVNNKKSSNRAHVWSYSPYIQLPCGALLKIPSC